MLKKKFQKFDNPYEQYLAAYEDARTIQPGTGIPLKPIGIQRDPSPPLEYYTPKVKNLLNRSAQMRYRITKLDPKGKKTEITTVIADYYTERSAGPMLYSPDYALRFYNNIKGFWGPKEPKLVATVALSGDYLVETV